MTSQELFYRFDLLSAVLNRSKARGYLSIGQRVCLHQERSAIMQAIDWMLIHDAETAEPGYRIPDHLEKIVEQIQRDFNL